MYINYIYSPYISVKTSSCMKNQCLKKYVVHRMAKCRARLQIIIPHISKLATGNLTSLYFFGISSSSAKAK